jgi:hypothetical protein
MLFKDGISSWLQWYNDKLMPVSAGNYVTVTEHLTKLGILF